MFGSLAGHDVMEGWLQHGRHGVRVLGVDVRVARVRVDGDGVHHRASPHLEVLGLERKVPNIPGITLVLALDLVRVDSCTQHLPVF